MAKGKDQHELLLTLAEMRALHDHLTKLTTGRIVVSRAATPMIRTGGDYLVLRRVLRKLDARILTKPGASAI